MLNCVAAGGKGPDGDYQKPGMQLVRVRNVWPRRVAKEDWRSRQCPLPCKIPAYLRRPHRLGFGKEVWVWVGLL